MQELERLTLKELRQMPHATIRELTETVLALLELEQRELDNMELEFHRRRTKAPYTGVGRRKSDPQ